MQEDLNKLLSRAQTQYRKEDYQAVIKTLSEMIKILPDHSDYYMMRGEIYHTRKEYVNAILDFELAIKYNSKNENAIIGLADSNIKNGNVKEAFRVYCRAIAQNIDNPNFYINRARLRQCAMDVCGARADYAIAARMGDEEGERMQFEWPSIQNGRSLEDMIDDIPLNVDEFINEALSAKDKGDLFAALGLANRAVQIYPHIKIAIFLKQSIEREMGI